MTNAMTPIQRLDSDALRKLVGDSSFEYLNRKQRGGDNGYKGNRYEQFFGAHRIARLGRKLIESNEDALVEWQSNGFVDDFVVRRDFKSSFKGYQLKNAERVSWHLGVHPIRDDFSLQHTICTEEKYADIRLRLVTSDDSLASELKDGVPGSIRDFSKAFFFPYDESAAILFNHHEWMAEDFGFMSRNPGSALIDAFEVAGVLVGAWALRAPKARVSEVLDQARRMSPMLLRSPRSDSEAAAQLSPEFRQVFDALPDFHYSVERGFLRWQAVSGSTSGVLSFDCFHEKFHALQQYIVGLAPKTFEEVEGVLL